ncbi:sensor histidine kinase [Mucilaginibacter pedocola]|uniref:histidine kinase n=1 Tax=Mucilaginibacter pedocola TaxID=1792845 RepID=A0A1S9P9W5_9SPHI|nr:histidine kinase dimerization/phosphoacceptor domain -containing protein [Mucilaginibacter pedocola]OOQ57776.1 hypothetical protein BC343_13390 [Mucilaginibacter pedocola]
MKPAFHFATIVLLAFSLKANAQYFPREREGTQTDITKAIINLNASKPGQERIQAMLNLGTWYLFKPFQSKTDIDSAFLLANNAKQLSLKLKYTAGYQEAVMLTAGCYSERGDRAAAKAQLKFLSGQAKVTLLTYIGDQYYYIAYGAGPVPGLVYLDTAITYYRAKFAESKKLKSDKLIHQSIEHLLHCSEMFREAGRVADADKQVKWLKTEAGKIGYPVTDIRQHLAAAQKSLYAGDYTLSMKETLSALKLLDAQTSDHDRGSLYRQAGNLYRLTYDYKKSNYYYNLILAEPERFESAATIYGVVNNVSYNLGMLGRPQEGLDLVLGFGKRYTPKTDGDEYYLQRALGQNYARVNRPDLAVKYLLASIQLIGKARLSPSADYRYLGDAYLALGEVKKASEAFEKSAELSSGQHAAFISSLYKARSHTDSLLGNYQSALGHLLQSKRIDDSIYTESKEKHTQELEVQYETQKKEALLAQRAANIAFLKQTNSLQVQNAKLQAVKLSQADQLVANNKALIKLREHDLELKTKDYQSVSQIAALQHTQLEQASLNKRITATVIGLLVVIIILIYRQFRQKRKSSQLVSEKNEQLSKLLNEKEWLLKEVHHRVKNNLQTIVNLLESQSDHLAEPALSAIETSKNRIFAMSLIHHKLYLSDESTKIDMPVYISELVSFLRETFSGRPIVFNIDADPVKLDATRAIPIGLIINELVTNSLKYAFREQQKGIISIALKVQADCSATLTIADNGIGLPGGQLSEEPKTMGLKLVRGLTRQLDGELNIQSSKGTTFVICSINIHEAAAVI